MPFFVHNVERILLDLVGEIFVLCGSGESNRINLRLGVRRCDLCPSRQGALVKLVSHVETKRGEAVSIQRSLLRFLGRDRRSNRNLSKPKARLDYKPHLCNEYIERHGLPYAAPKHFPAEIEIVRSRIGILKSRIARRDATRHVSNEGLLRGLDLPLTRATAAAITTGLLSVTPRKTAFRRIIHRRWRLYW